MDKEEHARLLNWRKIWQKNKKSGRHRRFEKPWLIHDFFKQHVVIDKNGNIRSVVTKDHIEVYFSEHQERVIPRREQVQRFRQSIEHLYWQAVAVSNLARQYREFYVGCALLAFRPGRPLEETWEMHLGMNSKVQLNSRPVCAEPIAISSARAGGSNYIVGIVIVGDLREEDIGKIKTLHPCQECRILMEDNPAIRPETIIITAKPPVNGKPGEYEIRTFKRLRQMHKHEDHW